MRIRTVTVPIALCALAGPASAQMPLDPPASVLPDSWRPSPGLVIAESADPPPQKPASAGPAAVPVPDSLPAPTPVEPKAAPTLAEIGLKVEALGKNLTVVTGDEQFKLVLGGAVVTDAIYATQRPVAPVCRSS